MSDLIMRYIYNTGNHYEELFGLSSYWFDIDEQGLSSKFISHPFRYHSINNLKNGDTYYNEEDFFRYFYLGLAFKKDSILGKYFFRFRVDKFYFNGKAKTSDNGYLVSGYYIWRENYYKTVISSMQFSPCFGRSFKNKFLTIDLGIEIPLYIRGEQEEYYSFEEYDTTESKSGSFYSFNTGGYFVGIFLSGSLNFSISKHYSIGLDGSTGFIYANDYFWVKQGATRTRFIAHYPALTLSYKF